ncbi:MAG: co-chaperone GroES [Bacillota bacterium]|nr:co-chaperone GroES [Bacillota bacterium]
MNLRPIGNKIIIKKIEVEEKSIGGIILPGSAKGDSYVAEVLAIGPDILNDEKRKDQVKVGDKVVYNKYGLNTVKIDDQEYIICKLDDLYAVIK